MKWITDVVDGDIISDGFPVFVIVAYKLNKHSILEKSLLDIRKFVLFLSYWHLWNVWLRKTTWDGSNSKFLKAMK